MRVLLTTLMTYESEFYGAVGRELERRGHEVDARERLAPGGAAPREQGSDARCLADVVDELGEPASLDDEVHRIEQTYAIPHLRSVYRTTGPASGRSEEWCIRRTVDHFRALEHVFDERPTGHRPPRGRQRDDPGRRAPDRALDAGSRRSSSCTRSSRIRCASTSNTLHAPIAPLEELRGLTPGGARRGRGVPTRRSRRPPSRSASTAASRSRPRRVKVFAGHVRRKLTEDRDNDYLRPWRTAAPERVRVATGDASHAPSTTGSTPTGRSSTSRSTSPTTTRSSGSSRTASTRPRWSSRWRTRCRRATTSSSRSIRCRSGGTASACSDGCARRPNVRLVNPYTNTHELIRRVRRRSR